MKSGKLVIAIDGPAASGKSTTARLTAEHLGYLHIDTGAMYRAMTLKVLREGINLEDEEAIGRLAAKTEIRFRRVGGEIHIVMDDEDVSGSVRSRGVTKAVSAVSSIRKVREVMVREQRRMGDEGGIVLEGRDIGTVVFPDADLKIFLVAKVEERARRRQADLKNQGIELELEMVQREISDRDALDSKRVISPLKKADDAVVLDTSNLTIPKQVDFIVDKARELLKAKKEKR